MAGGLAGSLRPWWKRGDRGGCGPRRWECPGRVGDGATGLHTWLQAHSARSVSFLRPLLGSLASVTPTDRETKARRVGLVIPCVTPQKAVPSREGPLSPWSGGALATFPRDGMRFR